MDIIKKLLGIVILGLLLSGNAYAATKFTYLSCKQIIKENKSENIVWKPNNYLSIGRYTSHIFYKFKDLKKKTTISVYEVGNPFDRDWKSNKPKLRFKSKFQYNKKDSIYSGGEEISGQISTGYGIQNINGEYFQTTIFKGNAGGTINDIHLIMDSKCEIVDKKNFNKLIKNKIN